jgi:uncharacterized protein (DUF433 family)
MTLFSYRLIEYRISWMGRVREGMPFSTGRRRRPTTILKRIKTGTLTR